MSAPKPLTEAVENALQHDLVSDAVRTSRAAFGAGISPMLGSLILEIADARRRCFALLAMPPEERPRAAWLDDDDPDAELEPLEYATRELTWRTDIFDRATAKAVLQWDSAFFEQVALCFAVAANQEADAVENLRWLSSYGMAALIASKAESLPTSGEVNDWFNAGLKHREKEASQARDALKKRALDLPLADGKRGKKRGKSK